LNNKEGFRTFEAIIELDDPVIGFELDGGFCEV